MHGKVKGKKNEKSMPAKIAACIMEMRGTLCSSKCCSVAYCAAYWPYEGLSATCALCPLVFIVQYF
eukprot:1158670-Pelagomonas_calceolata.AAC.3